MAELTVRGLCLAPEHPRVIVPLYAENPEQLAAQTAAAQASACADLAELRLDPLPRAQYAAAIAQTRAALDKPLLITLRTRREGGLGPQTPAEYADAVQQILATGAADLIDIEYSIPHALLLELRAAAQEAFAVPVYSQHHFEGTPPTDAMVELLVNMSQNGAGIAKLAVMPGTAADAARLLTATATAAARCPDTPLLTMSMGQTGEITRFCGYAFGSVATFGTLGAASAPGQPSAQRLAAALAALTGAADPAR